MVLTSVDEVQSLKHQNPARLQLIDGLAGFLEPSLPSPPVVLVYDAHSPRYTEAVIENLLGALHTRSAPSCHIFLSPLTTPSTGAVCKRILSTISKSLLPEKASGSSSRRIDGNVALQDGSLDDFLRGLRRVLVQLEESLGAPPKLVITVREAHRMRDMWSEALCEVLARMAEVLQRPGQITLLLLSLLPASHFRTASGGFAASSSALFPVQLTVPRLDEQETTATLSYDSADFYALYTASSASAAEASDPLPEDMLAPTLRTFLTLCQATFSSHIRDIFELRSLAMACWAIACIPLRLGVLNPNNPTALKRRIAPYLLSALQLVHTRELGETEWIENAREQEVLLCTAELEATHLGRERSAGSRGEDVEMSEVSYESEDSQDSDANVPVEAADTSLSKETAVQDARKARRRALRPPRMPPSLSPLTTYLLLASFLASYKPARLDTRFFLRESERGAARRKHGGRTRKEGEPLNTQRILGPKPFPFERLLAIYQFLLLEHGRDVALPSSPTSTRAMRSRLKTGHTDDLERQRSDEVERHCRSREVFRGLRHLQSRRLVVRTNAGDRLDGLAFRSNVDFEYADVMARKLDVPLNELLWDF